MLPFSQTVFSNTRQKHHVKQALGFLCELIERAESEAGLQAWVEKRIGESELPSDDAEMESTDAAEIIESVLCPNEITKQFDAFLSADDEAIDEQFNRIHKLDKDRQKQGGLYVDIDRSGQPISRPSDVTPEISQAEIETASRATDMLRGLTSNWTYDFKAYEVSRVTMERFRERIRAREEDGAKGSGLSS